MTAAVAVDGPAIDVRELTKIYAGGTRAVDGVSFEVERGELFGLLGPNGAGKTTTIKIICTLLRPTAGRAAVAGYDVVAEPGAVRRAIGLVFQEPTLDDYLTAEQNLRFHAYAYGLPRHVCDRRIMELLELVELADRRRDKVASFSGGMKRRLEIARGLLHRPQVLFLDEPTLGLDPQTRRRVWDYLLELRARERLTVLMTTHYMDEAERCDRIAIVDQGRIVALDTPERLKDTLGGDIVSLKVEDAEVAVREIDARYRLSAQAENGAVSFTVPRGEEFLPEFVRSFDQPLQAVGVRRPSLDDVFLHLTGRAIRDEQASDSLAELRRLTRLGR